MKRAPYKRWHIVWFHTHKTSWTGKFIETESRLVKSRLTKGLGWGWGGHWEVTTNGDGLSLWDDKNVLESGNGDGFATLWMYRWSLSCIL